ncbi:MAG: menaquinone biosynthesis protein [Gemmatimonadaceae bacterium]|nr:menaquinone biosynthesis protein [Gemmatimonadaceae bacterium]
MRVGRIPYINCYPVYGAIDAGVVRIEGELVTGVPSALNQMMSRGQLDVSVVSAVEYARASERYLLLPDLAISCDGPVRSVLLLSKVPAPELGGQRVILSRSSMTSVALLELLFESVWHARPAFAPGDAELTDVARFGEEAHEARLVIGDAALVLGAGRSTRDDRPARPAPDGRHYPYVYDLGAEWKRWTGLPFVFAVWVAQRSTSVNRALAVHAALIESRSWGLRHLDRLAERAAETSGVDAGACREYLSGLDYGLSYAHLSGLTEFFRRLHATGRVPDGELTFLGGR